MKKEMVYLLLAGAVLFVIVLFGWNNLFTQKPAATSQTSQIPVKQVEEMNKNSNTKQPAMTIDVNKTYTATLVTTEGDITVSLNAKDTPITVNNFIYLAKKGFYANTIFHRVIKGFMIQGGDPDGDGTGGPGYTFDDEPVTGNYTRGIIAMANSGPNTNGSQFFIMHADTDLAKSYVIFGKVLEGMDVVDKIANAPVKNSGEGSSPINPVHIQSITITEK